MRLKPCRCGCHIRRNYIMGNNISPSDGKKSFTSVDAGWFLLGLFLPLAGIILWCLWHSKYPDRANWCRNGVIVSVLGYVALYVVLFLLSGVLAVSTLPSRILHFLF